MMYRVAGAIAASVILLAGCSTHDDYKKDLEGHGFTDVNVSVNDNDVPRVTARVTLGTCKDVKLAWIDSGPMRSSGYQWAYVHPGSPSKDFIDEDSSKGVGAAYLLTLDTFKHCAPGAPPSSTR